MAKIKKNHRSIGNVRERWNILEMSCRIINIGRKNYKLKFIYFISADVYLILFISIYLSIYLSILQLCICFLTELYEKQDILA